METNLGRYGDVFRETNLGVNLGWMHLIIYFGEMKGRPIWGG